MKKLLALLLTAVMSVTMLTACGGNETASTTEETASAAGSTAESGAGGEEEVAYKDTLVLVTATDQNYMDGQMNNTNDKILRMAYSSLVRKDPVTNETVGDLAESWEVSDDGLTWTFHLRKGVKFHNGKELTATDVKASYDRLLNEDDPVRYTSTMNLIKSCEIVDDYTVTLSTEEPTAALLPNLLHRANLILDADYIEQYGKELGLTAESINGTGPYKITTWNQGELMVGEAFEDYYGGAPATPRIEIQIMPEASSRAIALETGEADIADGLTTEDIENFRNMEGFTVQKFESNGVHLYQFNCANEYLEDVRVRQAILYAVDMETIVNALYAPKGETICDAPLNPNIWGYTSMGVIPYDPEKAKELLAEAGYPDGFEMDVMIVQSYDKALESAEMIKAQLEEVGITMNIDVVETAVFNEAFTQTVRGGGGNFPWAMFIIGQGPGTCDADGMRRYYTTEGETNANNYGWYSNAEVDQLLADAAREMDEEKRMDLYERIMEIVWLEDPAGMWMNNRATFYCMTDKVEDFRVDIRNAVDFSAVRVRAD